MATGKFFEQFVTVVPGFVGHLIFSLIIIGVFGVMCKFLQEEDFLVKWLFSKAEEGIAKTMGHVLVKSLRAVVVIVGALTLAGEWGFDLKPVLASLGIVSVALALAAQDMVKNFIGAFVVLIEDIFRIGDKIAVGGVTGVVETINFRSTQIRTDEGNLVYVPNSIFSSSNVTKVLKTKRQESKKVVSREPKKESKKTLEKVAEKVVNKEPKNELKQE